MPGLKKEYISFDCDLAKKEEKGMLERLREMPKGKFNNVNNKIKNSYTCNTCLCEIEKQIHFKLNICI